MSICLRSDPFRLLLDVDSGSMLVLPLTLYVNSPTLSTSQGCLHEKTAHHSRALACTSY